MGAQSLCAVAGIHFSRLGQSIYTFKFNRVSICTLHTALVAVIVVGVAVIISLCVLLIGLIIIRRYSIHSLHFTTSTFSVQGQLILFTGL